MAAPMKEADSNRRKLEDDALDLSSPSFDPLRALYSRRTQLPCPDIVPLNNIAEYVSYSEGKSRRQRRRQTDTVAVKPQEDDGKSISRDTKESFSQKCASGQNTTTQNDNADNFAKATTGNDERDDKRKTPRNRRNVLTRLEGYQRGPLSFLRRCVNEKLLIQVWIRSAVDLRGMCKGYLISFDKHFNLAMIDVDELYRCPISKEMQQRKENKREKRRLKQLKDQMAELSVTEQPLTTTDVCLRTSVNREESENKILSSSLAPNETTAPKTELIQESLDKDFSKVQPVKSIETLDKNLNDSLKGTKENKIISSSLAPNETTAPKTELTQESLDKDFSKVQPVKSFEILDRNLKDSLKGTEESDLDSSNRQDQIAEQVQSTERSTLPCEQVPATSSEQDPVSVCEEPASQKSSSPFRERHVNQLFIRGDNVVSIMILD